MKATLYQASFQDTLNHIQMAGGAHLIFTSPPYCDARAYGNEISWGMEDYARLGDAIFAALKPGGNCIFNVDAPIRNWRDGFGTERGLHPWRLLLDWADRVGFRSVERLAYARMGAPGAYAGRFRNDWEPMFWFQKPGGDGFFYQRTIAVAAKHKAPKVSGVRHKDGMIRNRAPSGWAVENSMCHRGTLWDYGNIGGAKHLDHPATFAYPLAVDVVKCFAPPNGVVADPFLGSGTVAMAALDHGCNFIGGDLFCHPDGTPWVSKVADAIRKRCDTGILSMFGESDDLEIQVFGVSQ